MCVGRTSKLHNVFFYKDANAVDYKGPTLGPQLNQVVSQILHLQMPKCWELGLTYWKWDIQFTHTKNI